jgi:hypothetical protein
MEPWVLISIALSICSFGIALYGVSQLGAFDIRIDKGDSKTKALDIYFNKKIDRQRIASSECFSQIEDRFKEQDRKSNKNTRIMEKKVAQNREMVRKLGQSYNWSGFDEDLKEVFPKSWDQHLNQSEQRRIVYESESDLGLVRTIFSPLDLEVMTGSHFFSAVFDPDTDGKIVGHALLSSSWDEALEAHHALEKGKLKN